MFIDLIPSSDIFLRNRKNYTLTIIVKLPAGITSTPNIVLYANGYSQQGNSITVMADTLVSYSVDAEGCEPSFGDIRVTSNRTLEVQLQSEQA